MGVGGQCRILATLPSGNRPRIHCTGGWVGPKGRSGWAAKISPRTIQPVAGRYANYSIMTRRLHFFFHHMLMPSLNILEHSGKIDFAYIHFSSFQASTAM
jgi:hypothetical protein